MTTDSASYSKTYTVFAAEQRIATGPIMEVALKARALVDAKPEATILLFDDETGEVVDVSLNAPPAQLEKRLRQRSADPLATEDQAAEGAPAPVARGRGRPKLGVVAREVTLLPRHWEWLDSQPGSASVVLRRLVEEARRTHAGRDRRQKAQNATYKFLVVMAGDRMYFEDAIRALFADDRRRFHQLTEAWPVDIRRHAERLSADAFTSKSSV
jgi:uncharacterized protein